MRTALVGHIDGPDRMGHTDGRPDPRGGHGKGKGGDPEGYRAERLYHSTVLSIPSSRVKGGVKWRSFSNFAELTRKEPVILRKSSDSDPPIRTAREGSSK